MEHTIPAAPSWPVESQYRANINPIKRKEAELHWLPELIRLWQLIEKTTGYKWKATSYWRNSPSHQMGYALDIAPDISPSVANKYAVTNLSDPVLYKREKLIRKLQSVARQWRSSQSNWRLGMFIEPDHIHMHILQKQSASDPDASVVKWCVVKDVYKDSKTRSELPLIKS